MDKAEALARIKADQRPIAPDQKYQVDRFQPGDAWGVARLFYEIYGEDYPVEDSYIPERIIQANAEGRVRTVVTRTAAGEVIGQTALYRSSPPNPNMYEYGQMLLVHAYRNSLIAGRMNQFVGKHLVGRDGVDAAFGEAVCNHLATQKMSKGMNFFPCAMELGLMPEEAYEREGAVGRVSCLVFVRVDVDPPQPLFIPECWRELAEAGLKAFTLARQAAVSGQELPPDGATDMQVQHFDFAGVARCHVAGVGADFPARLRAELDAAAQRGDAVVQFYLGLNSPWSGGAARALRQAGCFCGGVAPCWFPAGQGGDALLVQRFLRPVPLAAINLFSEEAEAFCGLVLRDMERAGREFGAPVGILAPAGPAEDEQPAP